MNYKKIYENLILKAKSENRIKSNKIYYEKHHILPKCLGGNNKKENIVLLTAKEHFICHWLLWRFSTNEDKHKMGHAFFLMRYHNSTNRYYSSTSYEISKKAHAKASSYFHKGRKLSKKQLENRKYGKKVLIKNLTFNSIKEASKYYNISVFLIRKYIRGEINEEYLFSKEYRKKIKIEKQKISLLKKFKERGKKTYEELYGKEVADKLLEKKRLAKIGKIHSEETKRKISKSNTGKSSWNKGKKFSKETCKKMSDSRKGDSRSNKSYKIIDPNGKEYLVEKKGLPWFWINILNEKFPSSFKKISSYKEGINGKWKGWKVYVFC